MIGTIPKAYPDELIYSVLARSYVADGYMIYREFAEDVFVNKREAPSVEFLGGIKPDIIKRLCVSFGVKDITALICRGTQYPYYTRFYTPERKKQALDALIKGESITDLIRLTTQKEKRFLRYCPKCVLDDRSNYGETYWHRSHQMKGVNFCYKHCIRLASSGLVLSGKASPNFHTAEIALLDLEEEKIATEKEVMLAQFNKALLDEPLDMDGNATPLVVINNTLYDLGFISKRGGAYRLGKIEAAMADFYKECPEEMLTTSQISKFLAGKRMQPIDYARMAVFLGIDIKSLLGPAIQNFCIAKSSNPRGRGGCTPKNWEALDRKMLPQVMEYISNIKDREEAGERPVKITTYTVASNIGVPYKSFPRLKNCTDYIRQFDESREEYWAREIVWAYHTINNSAEKMQYASFRKLLNVRRRYMVAALPHIEDVRIREVIEEIAQQ